MRSVVISLALAAGIFAIGACGKKQAIASQQESYATVTMADGSSYHGQLVSKSGSQMIFRGDNGAARTFASQDVQSIRFDAVGSAPIGGNGAPVSANPYGPGATPPVQYNPPTDVRRGGVMPSGTWFSVRNNEGIDSRTASAGQTFSAVISADVLDDSGAVAIPRGASATLVVMAAHAGRIHANNLALELSSVAMGGVNRDVQTGTLFQKGRAGVGMNKRTAIFTAGGAALGALIGGLAGGGRGVAIGAASGAGASAGTEIMTRGSVRIPSETLMSFRLRAPLAE
jgi:hypothetical protein